MNDHPRPELLPLPGSRRSAVPGAVPARRALATDQLIEVTLVLRRRASASSPSTTTPPSIPTPPSTTTPPSGPHLNRGELEQQHGADPADIAAVTEALVALGAEIKEVHPASRLIRASGPQDVLTAMFGTSLEQVSAPGPEGGTITFRQRTGGLSVPAAFAGAIIAVLGLDTRPAAAPRIRVSPAAAVARSYTPVEIAKLYRFPPNTDGRGQRVAIIELGGGFDQSDLDAYFAGLGVPSPSVTAIGVDGATNRPGQDPNGADGEVMLDIEVVGAVAPGAAIDVYFAPNTDSGFLDALSRAVHAPRTPVAISISWGQSEDRWTAQARTAFDHALEDAALLGVTVTAAAGDNGSSDGATDRRDHVDFPASSPFALACGGTRLEADPSTATIAAETVWNNAGGGATGGGISNAFALPSWQSKVGVQAVAGRAGRGVPDVAGNADPQTGYQVRVAGRNVVIGGTSAVSPLWAALLARVAQATGRSFGLVQAQLYRDATAGTPAPGFRDITNGNNGAYQAGSGWDPCTGLGVPVGDALLTMLGQSPRRR